MALRVERLPSSRPRMLFRGAAYLLRRAGEGELRTTFPWSDCWIGESAGRLLVLRVRWALDAALVAVGRDALNQHKASP